MIEFNTWNTHFWDILEEQPQSLVDALQSKRWDLGFIDVDKTTDVEEITKYVNEVWDNFDTIVVLGIWWSALGTKALLESLYGKYYNENQNKLGKNIYVLDNIDPDTFSDIEEIINIKRTLFIFISKSGGTIETLSEYLYFRDKVQNKVDDWKKHFCFIVWENCKMRDELEKNFKTFYIPENIGGRFSVFTEVWLVPLAFAGVDISLFLEWISDAKERALSLSPEHNPALFLALTQYKYYKKWKNITVFFPYSSRMFMLGEWYKQLMGESIWKAWEGITLTSSLWVTDQHSQLQLYQDGPQDKLFLMLSVEHMQDKTIENSIPGFTFQKLLEIEKYGTETSLKNEGHPVCNIALNQIDEKHIAELLYIFMFQIAYLGELFHMNAFDQPGVEKSKIITKQKLKEEFRDMGIFQKAFYE